MKTLQELENVLFKAIHDLERLKGTQKEPTCVSCGSFKLVEISAKCADMCFVSWWKGRKTGQTNQQEGYVPTVLGLGEDHDYVDMTFCVQCGQIHNYESDFSDE